MNQELTGYAEQVQLFKSGLSVLTKGLSGHQVSWKPSSQEWSIAECFDHLNTVGFLLLPRMDHAIKAGRDAGLTSDGPFKYGLMGRWFIQSLQPGAKRRMKTFRLYWPSPLSDPATVIQRCGELQEHLLDLLRKSDGLNLVKIRVSSPVNALLRFSLGVWFASTIAHQHRHLAQAQRVRDNSGFPKT